MSVSLRDVIEAGGFDLSLLEDCEWLLSVEDEFDQLIEEAEEVIEKAREEEDE